MSEQMNSDPISTAYQLEREIADIVSLPKEQAQKQSKVVRDKMGRLLEMLKDKNLSDEYSEAFGGLTVERTQAELLHMIHEVLPRVGTELGWNQDIENTLQVETDYETAA